MTDIAEPALRRGLAIEADDEVFWGRVFIGFHVVFFGTAAITALIIVEDSEPSTVAKATSLAALALLGVLYLGFGIRAFGGCTPWRSAVFLAPAWATLIWLAHVHPGSYLMLFALIPLTWAMLSPVAAIITMFLAMAALSISWLATGRDATETLIESGINLTLSIVVGLFITGVVRESERRAHLIKQLTDTQAELAAAERERGVLTERERLAGEIHDTLAQGLTSILNFAQAAEASLDRDPEIARHRIGLVEQVARNNLAEARALIAALQPADLDGATLRGALERIVDRFGQEADIPAHLDLVGTPRAVPPNVEVVVVRATQEALANVLRHAKASTVSVTLVYGARNTTLEVRDNGRGFDVESVDGFGLRGMRTRTEQAGGRLEVDSRPGSGTTVRLTLPCPTGNQ